MKPCPLCHRSGPYCLHVVEDDSQQTTRLIREYIDAKKAFDRLDAGEKERALKANPDFAKCLNP